MDNSPVMMEKPDDLTLEECQEAFAMLRLHKAKMNKANFDLIMTLANQGLWHICEQIFGYLNYETVENCRKVSELWNESLERIALVKFLQEFGDKLMENPDWEPIPGKPAKCWEQFDKVSNIFFWVAKNSEELRNPSKP